MLIMKILQKYFAVLCALELELEFVAVCGDLAANALLSSVHLNKIWLS